MAFITKIRAVLDTLQVYDPRQYLSTLPIFWYNITTSAIEEITK